MDMAVLMRECVGCQVVLRRAICNVVVCVGVIVTVVKNINDCIIPCTNVSVEKILNRYK